MYAVFEDGSRQYRVSEGDLVKVDYREDAKGSRLEFPRVLLYNNAEDFRVGQPTVEGMRVVGQVVDHPSTKYTIQKFRRRKNYRRFRGHRQHFTLVKVQHILLPGQEPPAPPPEQQQTPPTPAPAENQAPAPAPTENPTPAAGSEPGTPTT